MAAAVQQLQEQVRELRAAVAEVRSEAAQYRAETGELRRELQATREQLASTTGPAQPSSYPAPTTTATQEGGTAAANQRGSLEDRVSSVEDSSQLLSSKVDDQYQTKVESASKYRVRLSGIVLLALPPALFVAVWRLNPDYVLPLFTDPLGKQMLLWAVVMQILGALVIRKIVNIKV